MPVITRLQGLDWPSMRAAWQDLVSNSPECSLSGDEAGPAPQMQSPPHSSSAASLPNLPVQLQDMRLLTEALKRSVLASCLQQQVSSSVPPVQAPMAPQHLSFHKGSHGKPFLGPSLQPFSAGNGASYAVGCQQSQAHRTGTHYGDTDGTLGASSATSVWQPELQPASGPLPPLQFNLTHTRGLAGGRVICLCLFKDWLTIVDDSSGMTPIFVG